MCYKASASWPERHTPGMPRHSKSNLHSSTLLLYLMLPQHNHQGMCCINYKVESLQIVLNATYSFGCGEATPQRVHSELQEHMLIS